MVGVSLDREHGAATHTLYALWLPIRYIGKGKNPAMEYLLFVCRSLGTTSVGLRDSLNR